MVRYVILAKRKASRRNLALQKLYVARTAWNDTAFTKFSFKTMQRDKYKNVKPNSSMFPSVFPVPELPSMFLVTMFPSIYPFYVSQHVLSTNVSYYVPSTYVS